VRCAVEASARQLSAVGDILDEGVGGS